MKKIKILIGSLLIATLMTGCASKKNNNITKHPTIVVYDCSANNNSAYSFSGCESLDEIKKVLLSQRQQNSSGTSIMKLC